MTLRDRFDKFVASFPDDAFSDLFKRRKLSWEKVWDTIKSIDMRDEYYTFGYDWGEMNVMYKTDDFFIWFIEDSFKERLKIK